MENLNTYELKAVLASKGAKTTGLKSELQLRLRRILSYEGKDPDNFEFKLQETIPCTRNEQELRESEQEVLPPDLLVSPNDSASNAPQFLGQPRSNVSHASTTSSLVLQRIQERARRAELEERQKWLEDKQRLELQQMKLQQDQERLEIQSQMAQTKAREEVLSKFENSLMLSPRVGVPLPLKPPLDSVIGPCHVNQEGMISTDAGRIDEGLLSTLVSYNLKSMMPRAEIKKFDGDFKEYLTFIQTFDSVISSKLTTEKERIHYLEQYTLGRPREIVRACLHLRHNGYEEARRLLSQRYGNPDRIASSFIQQILEWNQIRFDDVEGLDEYSIVLRNCLNALSQSEGIVVEMDHPKTIREVLNKLPFYIQDKWRRKADKISEFQQRRACFSDLVEFIEEESRIVNNPSYGKAMFMSNTKSKQNGEKSRVLAKVSCNATGEKSKISCWICQKEHYMGDCPELMKMTLEERIQTIKDNHLCFGCLRYGHMSRECSKRITCEVCGNRHPTILHRYDAQKEESSAALEFDVSRIHHNATVRMNIVPVIVSSPHNNTTVKAYAFLDNGSTASFCTNALCRKLGIEPNLFKSRIAVSTIHKRGIQMDCNIISNLKISDLERRCSLPLPQLYAIESIPASKRDIVKMEDLNSWPQFSKVDIPIIDSDVELLIGMDVPSVSEPLEVINSQNGSPYAVRTRLGWVVSGVSRKRSEEISVNKISVSNTELNNLLLELYNREFHDISSVQNDSSVEDRRWNTIAQESCRRLPDGSYEMALPFKDENVVLPDSRYMAMKRMEPLKKKLMKDESYAKQYADFMNDMLKNQYAERVPEEELQNYKWYIPHFGVFQVHKPEKIRVVFDCAARVKGASLNDILLQGPDLTNELLKVLMKYRLGEHTYNADIQKMFYQVKVPAEQRDYLRFFWWDNGQLNSNPLEYRMNVHLFGARSSPSCSSYALRKTAYDNEHIFSPSIVQTVLENFYVDDNLKATTEEEELISVAMGVRSLCAEGGFKLEKFCSTNVDLMKRLPREAVQEKIMECIEVQAEFPENKILGITLDLNDDNFRIKIDEENFQQTPMTKRKLLSTIAGIYDPLGIAAPALLGARIILQEACRLKLGWDEDFPQQLLRTLEYFAGSLLDDNCFRLERNLVPKDVITYQLHHFSDASQQGFGVVSYLRVETSAGIYCKFVFGKARVAPLKTITIPRLELSAACLAVKISMRLVDMLKLPFSKIVYWTDSTTVLRYILSESVRFHTFVANRIALIRDGSQPDQWRYVPSKMNPGDDASRGRQSSRWLSGPEFLVEDEDKWPVNLVEVKDPCHKDAEIVDVFISRIGNDTNQFDILIEYYSSWFKLKKAVAYWVRLREHLVSKRPCKTGQLSTEEIQNAEKLIITYVQNSSFQMEISLLKNGRIISKQSSIIRLDPILSDGLLRVGGRLQQSGLDYDAQHPLILPSKHHIVELIIKETHENLQHLGRLTTLAKIRDQYWIIHGNKTVRRILSKCVTCKRFQGQPMTQRMSNLDQDNVNMMEPPFTSTGLDCFGPFYTKYGRGQIKRFGVIFICLTVRAIHLEMVYDMSTSSFINALRRFIARRGSVKTIRCDRGTNFVGAERELKEYLGALDHDHITNELLKKNINWDFNPPQASHFGGIWERPIRTVRKCLSSVIKQQMLTDESLVTLMCEIEMTINSRPLTAVSSDSNDPVPLTPQHLLTLRGTEQVLSDEEHPFNSIRNKWRQVQYQANLFWKRWQREYLQQLQCRQKWLNLRPNLNVDDIVLILEETKPRNQWLMGRVIEIKKSRDQLVRSATVRCMSGTLNRPISKLIWLMESEN